MISISARIGFAAIRLYHETATLLQPGIKSEHYEVIDETLHLLKKRRYI